MATYTQEQANIDVIPTEESVTICETIRGIDEASRTQSQIDELDRNERHIQDKMAQELFVNTISTDLANRISALNL